MKIALMNNKGGVAKSTSSCVMAQIMAVGGNRVLVIDADPQGNSTRTFGIKEDLDVDYEKLYCGNLVDTQVYGYISPSNFPNIDILPAGAQLSQMPYKIYDLEKTTPAAKLYFARNIRKIEEDYDFIIIDNAPDNDYLTQAAIAVADKVLIPINTDNYSYEGILGTIELIDSLNTAFGLSLELAGIFFTRVKPRTTLFKQMNDSYQEQFGDFFIPIAIRDCNAVAEANTAFIPLYTYQKKCTAVEDYLNLINYIGFFDNEHYRTFIDNHEDVFRKNRKEG